MHKVVECSVYLRCRWFLTEIFLDFPSGNADWDTRQENLTESSSIAGRCGSRAQEQPTLVSLFSSRLVLPTHSPPRTDRLTIFFRQHHAFVALKWEL